MAPVTGLSGGKVADTLTGGCLTPMEGTDRENTRRHLPFLVYIDDTPFSTETKKTAFTSSESGIEQGKVSGLLWLPGEVQAGQIVEASSTGRSAGRFSF